MKRSLAIFFVLFSLLFSGRFSAGQVQVRAEGDQIRVTVNGKPFTVLHTGAEARKPYLMPLLTASGKHVTRGFPDEKIAGEPTDHPHQRGMWLGYEHLSGSNIWELDPADPQPHAGYIRFQKVIETHDGDHSGGFTILAQWFNEDGKPVLDETLTLLFYAQPADSRIFDVNVQLKAVKLSTFEDARDGFIGFRLAPSFDESRGSKVVNSDGIRGADNIEGTHANWVDWQTDLEGEHAGIAVLNHPTNHRAPTAWRLKSFGLLFANPFAQRFYDKMRADGAMSLQPGDELQLRYRVLIHSAGTDIAAAFKEYSIQ